MTAAAATAVFGGTFNPVHFGHLRSARELLQRLPLDLIRFVPARLPPHRDAPGVSAEHRAAMVDLAIAGEPRFCCDRRELARPGPSYTVDTLASLRGELGAATPLVLVVGCDAFLGLERWHRWQQLFDFAHIVVMARPGWQLPVDGAIGALLRERSIDAAGLRAGTGGVLCLELQPWDISSTAVRALLQSGKDASRMVPAAVLAYIAAHGLYGVDAGEGGAGAHGEHRDGDAAADTTQE